MRDGCTVPFHFVQNQALVAGISQTPLSPNAGFGTRSLVAADTWAHFRVKEFRYRLHPAATAPTQMQIAGFIGGVQDTPPSSLTNMAELLPVAVLGSRATHPTDWVRPSKAELAGPFPWYKTIVGTADSTEEFPGVLIVAGTGTEGYILEVQGIWEFKTAVSTSNTPENVMARRAAERAAAAVKLRAVVMGATLPVPSAALARTAP